MTRFRHIFTAFPLYHCLYAMGLLMLPTVALPDTDEDWIDPDVEFNIDGAHKGASDLLNSFASQIDNYFAENVTSDEINNTSATLRFDAADPANGDPSLRAKIKLRLVLPRSEQRIRLLFDVDDDDLDGEARSRVQNLSENIEDQNLALALRFMRTASEKIRFNVDLGARRHDSRIQSFGRLRVRFEDNNSPMDWSYGINNDFRQYYSSGYLNRLRFDFWSNTSEDSSTVFRTSTGFEWKEDTPGSKINQTVGFYSQINSKSLIAFEVLANYRTSPDMMQSHYEGHQFRIRYRRNAFRPWFHFELWPGVSWLTENENVPELEGLLRMEIQFGQY